MKTLGEVLKLSTVYLQERNVDRARRMAEELIAFTLQLKRLDLYMQFDRPLEEGELTSIREHLKRKAKGEPLEYIFGTVQFYHCSFEITPAVLIPRPETELLIHSICEEIKGVDLKGKVAWDLCCGSGCLGISLKKRFPELRVCLSDRSKEALVLARRNAQKNGVQVEFFEGDLLAPFQGQRADLVICNPPYVSEAEYAALEPSVRDFEPRMALVGGKQGVEFYQRLNAELGLSLNPGAKVYFEIGATQGEAVKSLFNASCWKSKKLEKDLAGHDRFFYLEFE